MRRDLLLTIKNALGESLMEDGWKTDKKGGRKGKEDRIGEKGLREKHRKNTNTKGNNTQIVTKTNQIFINNFSSFFL